jgi:hypothetical protein
MEEAVNLTALIPLKEKIAISEAFTTKERDFLLDLISETVRPSATNRITVTGGDYTYEGYIVAAFRKRRSGDVRYVVEDDNGRLFIHNAKQVGLE